MCKKKRDLSALPTKTAGFLRRISIGKYDQGLYLDEQRHQSSVCGGLFTIFLVSVILLYLTVVLLTVFDRTLYSIDESSVLYQSSGILDAKVSEMEDQFPK